MRPRPDLTNDRYAVVYETDVEGHAGTREAFAYSEPVPCGICEEPGCIMWDLYRGEAWADEFDEHGADTVSQCHPHDAEPRDEAGALVRPKRA